MRPIPPNPRKAGATPGAHGEEQDQTPMNDQTINDFYGEPISIYTRAQALEDGTLYDLGPLAREAGIRFPVACTTSIKAELLAVPAGLEYCQDEAGRTWDLVYMLRCACKRAPAGESRIDFQVLFQMKPGKEPELFDLYALCGPGDNAEAVITVMQLQED